MGNAGTCQDHGHSLYPLILSRSSCGPVYVHVLIRVDPCGIDGRCARGVHALAALAGSRFAQNPVPVRRIGKWSHSSAVLHTSSFSFYFINCSMRAGSARIGTGSNRGPSVRSMVVFFYVGVPYVSTLLSNSPISTMGRSDKMSSFCPRKSRSQLLAENVESERDSLNIFRF